MRTNGHDLPGKVIRTIILGVMCLSLGLQWAVIQGIAWTTMLVSYSSTEGLIQGLSKTFDGEHPCPLCEAVEDGSQQSSRQAAETGDATGRKMDAVLSSILRLMPPPGEPVIYPELARKALQRSWPPAEGPPRA